MMRSQNHRTNMNTAKASVRKLRKVKPSEKNNIAMSPSLLDGSIASVARRLGVSGRLRYDPDPCAGVTRVRRRFGSAGGTVPGHGEQRVVHNIKPRPPLSNPAVSVLRYQAIGTTSLR